MRRAQHHPLAQEEEGAKDTPLDRQFYSSALTKTIKTEAFLVFGQQKLLSSSSAAYHPSPPGQQRLEPAHFRRVHTECIFALAMKSALCIQAVPARPARRSDQAANTA